jgi:hypothetical protein
MSAPALRAQLSRLTAERLDAVEADLGGNATYMASLEADIASARSAYVGAAVTEIASLRGQLDGVLAG